MYTYIYAYVYVYIFINVCICRYMCIVYIYICLLTIYVMLYSWPCLLFGSGFHLLYRCLSQRCLGGPEVRSNWGNEATKKWTCFAWKSMELIYREVWAILRISKYGKMPLSGMFVWRYIGLEYVSSGSGATNITYLTVPAGARISQDTLLLRDLHGTNNEASEVAFFFRWLCCFFFHARHVFSMKHTLM